ncbi:probable rRNA maturation factor [Clostridium amylolyticum]|uniref:Endoribonuclease YbeY n=1 Tax=Clostridium amylolyticum TaxID=1121298 RepID=A0A1M6CP54_9CLOT|nr:rRNA maturation RNase YbeY [Clostridium amylolyticum]SHI62822.1 probable rRNA maturation factor [Clostridium amylolyticum]
MIYIDDRQNKITAGEELYSTIESVIDFALKEEEVIIPYEISVVLVDNEEIKSINSDTRNIDKETDVLSFPILDYPNGRVFKEVYLNFDFDKTYMDGSDLVLGDIVLSLEKAKEQSEEFGHSFLREVCYLIVHSILHLLGYDHIKDEEKVIMRKQEENILQKLDIRRE